MWSECVNLCYKNQRRKGEEWGNVYEYMISIEKKAKWVEECRHLKMTKGKSNIEGASWAASHCGSSSSFGLFT